MNIQVAQFMRNFVLRLLVLLMNDLPQIWKSPGQWLYTRAAQIQ